MSKYVIIAHFSHYYPLLTSSAHLADIYGHSLCLACGQMGAGHVPELGDAVLDPTSGSAQVGAPRMLTQCEEGLFAAEALVPKPCWFQL